MPKDDPHRTRITAGGDRLEYFGTVTAHFTQLGWKLSKYYSTALFLPPTQNVVLYANISSMGYLCSLVLEQPEFVKFKVSMIPPDSIIDGFRSQERSVNNSPDHVLFLESLKTGSLFQGRI